MRVFTEIYDSLQNLISYFSGKSLKLMPPDALISAQNVSKCVGGRTPPGPAVGADSASRDSLAGFKGSYVYFVSRGGLETPILLYRGVRGLSD